MHRSMGYFYGYGSAGIDSSEMYKQAMYSLNEDVAFNKDQVPISQSLHLIKGDPYLSLDQKDVASVIFEGSENSRSGLTSGNSLMRSALAAGAGGGAGFLFGRAASAIFSLPPIVTKRLSGAGAVAGALLGTGIFTEFGR